MENLKKARTDKGYSQNILAGKVGVSRSTIAMWETGKSQPDNDSLKALSRELNVSTDYLLGNDMESSNLSAISTDTGEPPYFLDDEAREIAEELSKNPNLHILFDAARGVSADDLRFVIDMVNRFKQESE